LTSTEKKGKVRINDQETRWCTPITLVPFLAEKTKRIKVVNKRVISTKALVFGKLTEKKAMYVKRSKKCSANFGEPKTQFATKLPVRRSQTKEKI
jgi:hypothetical protein